MGFLLDLHPWLEHYLTPGDPCLTPGTTGEWNAFTGSSGGWIPVAFDLSAYAGQQVEVVVSYVTDPATGGLGAIVDDTKLVTTDGTTQAEGFEEGFGAWRCSAPPEGSPDNLLRLRERRTASAELVAVTATPRTRCSSASVSSSSSRPPNSGPRWSVADARPLRALTERSTRDGCRAGFARRGIRRLTAAGGALRSLDDFQDLPVDRPAAVKWITEARPRRDGERHL